jgi:hypothetical protein
MSETLSARLWQELTSKEGRASADRPGMCLITSEELTEYLHLAAFKWAEERTHGIQIEELRDLEGGLMGYWARGHYPLHHFREAANYYTSADERYDERYVREAASIRHEWWRTVPVSGEPGMVQYCSAEPKSRGAFAVTVTTVVEDRQISASSRQIADHQRAEARGFANGLNWALRKLDHIDSAAGDRLLAQYREENKQECAHV